jgi:hypothetical protein
LPQYSLATFRPRPWYLRYRFGIAACAPGGIALLVAFWLQFTTKQRITDVPDLRVTLPLLGATALFGILSLAKRERLKVLPVAGMGMAAAGVALGWFIVLGAIAAVTALTIVLIAKFH